MCHLDHMEKGILKGFCSCSLFVSCMSGVPVSHVKLNCLAGTDTNMDDG